MGWDQNEWRQGLGPLLFLPFEELELAVSQHTLYIYSQWVIGTIVYCPPATGWRADLRVGQDFQNTLIITAHDPRGTAVEQPMPG